MGRAVNPDILTEEDLCPIADHWTRGGLLEWLRSNGIPFVIARSGWPRVHRKTLERALGVTPDAERIEAKEVAFNFDAIK